MTRPIIPPQPYYPQVDKSVPAQVTVHLQRLYTTANDHDAAICLLKSQLTAVSTAAAAKTTIVTASETVTGGGTGTQTIGLVNNQTGATSYTTQQSDYGRLVVLDDASPIAVTLTATPVITLPWYATFLNLGTGIATLTPAGGTISYGSTTGASSMSLAGGDWAVVAFDGTNWWASTLPPIATDSILGVVKPDGSTITITSGGVISATGGVSPIDFTQVFMLMGG